jgi:SAM-dependent methyltransferase
MAGEQVTAAEIARLANVGRAAVSNWRRRHDDFPKPVGGPPTSPLFDLAEVQAWLEANGRRVTDAARRPSPGAGLASVAASLLPATTNLVLDPACGTGAMLAGAAQRFGVTTTYVGQDPDRANVEAARRALAEVDVNSADLFVGSPFTDDPLGRYRGAADAVVCLPPTRVTWPADEAMLDLPWAFGPPSQLDPYLAWLQVCYAYLKPDGVAVVLMPPAAPVRASGRRVRSELLRAGALRQVVALPERFAAHLSGPWQLWVLHRPAGRPQYTVQMVDLTRMRPDEVPTDEAGWRKVWPDPGLCRDVEAIELLDEDVLLLPTRHVEAPVRDVAPEYDKLRASLERLAATLDVRLPALPRGKGEAPQTLISITDLVRLGAISFVEKGGSVQPGDVVVPAGADRFDASVVGPDGQRVPGEVLRCDPEVIDPYFLACFLRSETNRRGASGTLGGTARLDLRRARIPRLPLSEQRQYGEAFRRLTEVTDRIDAVARVANEAVQTAIYGLTSGVISPVMSRTSPLPRSPRSRARKGD